MTPEDEINRFFKAFTLRTRRYVEGFPEYQKAVAAKNTVAALEIASAIASQNLKYRELSEVIQKRWPEFSR
jgi:hypothetical protein